jgi:phosphopantetheinyl transferase
MNAAPKMMFHWPEIPAPPPPGQPVVIRVVTAPPRRMARRELRIVLRQILAAWSRLSLEQLPLRETPRGPVWLGQLGGHALDISLSYAGDEGWIGLRRDAQIGVDTMPVQPVPEADGVARLYLVHAAAAAIQQSTDPAMAFAAACTELEARLKCQKLDLDEWSATQALVPTSFASRTMHLPGRRVVTVATTSTPSAPEETQSHAVRAH